MGPRRPGKNNRFWRFLERSEHRPQPLRHQAGPLPTILPHEKLNRNSYPLFSIDCSRARNEGSSADSKADALDQIRAEGMTEALQDFAAAITDDFVQPHAAVDIDKERTFGNSDRFCVFCDGDRKSVV